MGVGFQTIADVEATPDQAQELAAGLVRWLIDEGIIGAEQTECLLTGQGYPPGPNYVAASYKNRPDFLAFLTNGVEVVTERRVFYSMGAESVTCRFCRHAVVLEEESGNPNRAWEDLSDLIETWYETGQARGRCAGCGRDMSLNDWEWEPAWGFGYLGLIFWNWAGLRPQFIAEVSRRLGHHRTIYNGGKL